jgi:hypothetical protein
MESPNLVHMTFWKGSKMKKCVFAMTLLMCIPVYADKAVMVYNITQQGKPLLIDTDFTVTPATASEMETNFKVRAVLVINVDTDSLIVDDGSTDSNQTPTVILYGKDERNKKFAYKIVADVNDFVTFDKVIVGGKSQAYVVASWSFSDPNWGLSTAGDTGTFGKATKAVIAKGHKIELAKTLKGMGTIERRSNTFGDGDVIATFDPKFTRDANEKNKSVRTMADIIEADLE